MELLRTPVKSAIEIWKSLLVYGFLFTGYSLAEECGEIARHGSISVVQAFVSSKIGMHIECDDLRYNRTSTCSNRCNDAIESLLANNGGTAGRIFFTCECSDGSAVYSLEECEIDRDRLVVCPALYFLSESEQTTTMEPPLDTSKSSSTKAAPSTKPIIPPGEDCRKVRLNCQGGLACAQTFDYVTDKCLNDFSTDDKCSEDCKRAIDYSKKHPSSAELWGCACDPDSEEISWCRMYGRNGLEKTCEAVKYKKLGPTTAKKEEQTSDPGDCGPVQMVSVLVSVFIPLAVYLIQP